MDTWTIPSEIRSKYDAQFEIIQKDGAVTGDVARALFLKSGLEPTVLAKIWALADMDADGRIDKKEFSIALWLIAMKLKGIEVPDRLPQSLLAPPARPPPSVDPFGLSGTPPARPTPPPIPPAPIPTAAPQAARAGPPPPKPPPPVIPPAPMMQAVAPPIAAVTSPGEWAVPQQTKLRYTQLFNQHDRQRTGFLNGNQARGILMQTGLANTVLARIWQLSDINSDGKLSNEEFVLAMHLCELSKMGKAIPEILPLDLVPPSYRTRQGVRHDSVGSVGSTGSRGQIDGVASPPVMSQETLLENAGMPGLASFEDKRRENYERGQAELERRRQIIIEQQRRERLERERKEKEEILRREKLRQEQERKRQEEIEAEKERRRQREIELENERRRQQEQKEAARREMERQKELEWQRQRILELNSLKQRTQEGLSLLKRRKLDLCLQVERMSREVGEVNGKIAAQKEEVETAKSFIDGMRPQRDTLMAELSEVKQQLKQCSDQTLLLNQEKLNMQNQLASLRSRAGNKQRELETKIEMARKQILQFDSDIKNKTSEVEKAEQDVVDKENSKNTVNHVDESVWGGAPAESAKEKTVVSQQSWEDPTKADWGDDHSSSPAVPPPPTTASMDAWGDSSNSQAAWGAPEEPTTWAPADTSTSAVPKESAKYRALFEFEARNEDELSFQPGDIISVTVGEEGEPGWLAGELRGKTGWFPESYAEPLDPSGGVVGPSVVGEAEIKSTPLDTVQEEPSSEGETFYSVYQYDSTEDGDLCFPAGVAIKVTAKSGDWWTGTYNGISGMFPRNYVAESPPVSQPEETETATVPTTSVSQTVAQETQPVPETKKSTTSESKRSKKKPEVFMIVANYEPTDASQLALVKGGLVQVRKKTKGGWWEGETHQKGKGKLSGWFPSTYVKPLPGAGSTGDSGDTAADSGPTESQNGLERVKAVFEFVGQQDDELSFAINDIIIVTDKEDADWMKGYKETDASKREGLFPSSYIEPLFANDAVIENNFYQTIPEVDAPPPTGSANPGVPEDSEDIYAAIDEGDDLNVYCDLASLDRQDAANNNELTSITGRMQDIGIGSANSSQFSSIEEPHRSFSRSLSSQRFSPAKLSTVNYEHILDGIYRSRITGDEKERQNCIYELVSTEQAYVKDLMLVEKYFARPMRKSSRVSQEDAARMMVNWRELITCSDKILKAFRIRQTMSPNGVIVTIGDVILENVINLWPYVRFCSRQSQAMQLIQQRTEQDPWFGEICKQFSRNPLVNGMPLTSYLLKPMQRITKYPLLVEKILNKTPKDHPDHNFLRDASEKMQQLCSQINESVRSVENTERLEWCQRHLSGSQSSPRITFNSFTNYLGPRRLLHSGPVVKAKSGKELLALLFNDFLLLTQPMNGFKDFTKISNIFTDDRALRMNYRFYKQPFPIEKLVLEEPQANESSMEFFTISTEITNEIGGSERYSLNLRTNGLRDRTGWINKLRQAIANHEGIRREMDRLSNVETSLTGCGRLLVVVQCAKNLMKVNSEPMDTFCSLSLGGQTHKTGVSVASFNPSWNCAMQFILRDLSQDVLCINVLQKLKFSPNEFLGRTEIRINEINERRRSCLGIINYHDVTLLEVVSGTISLRVDLQLFTESPRII